MPVRRVTHRVESGGVSVPVVFYVGTEPGAYSVAEKVEIKKATHEIDAHMRRKRKIKK